MYRCTWNCDLIAITPADNINWTKSSIHETKERETVKVEVSSNFNLNLVYNAWRVLYSHKPDPTNLTQRGSLSVSALGMWFAIQDGGVRHVRKYAVVLSKISIASLIVKLLSSHLGVQREGFIHVPSTYFNDTALRCLRS